MSRARDVVEVIARELTNRPDEVKVTEAERLGCTLVELITAPSDLGRLIGRNGRTAAAVRMLAAMAVEQEGKKVNVEFLDSVPGRRT